MAIRRQNGWLGISALILASASVILADALTKIWAERSLAVGAPRPVLGSVFQLTLSWNTGVAFSVLAGTGYTSLVLTSAVVVVLLVWSVKSKAVGVHAYWAVALILGGGLANIGDRWPDGRVTDFLDFGVGAVRWSAFNLADSFIVLGTAFLVVVKMAQPWSGRV